MRGLSAEYKGFAFVALVAMCFMLVRVGWVLAGPDLEPIAEAQTGQQQQQYVSPTEQGNGRYVFTGSGADDVTTELFDISSSQWTILSESQPPNNQPGISVTNESGDLIDAPLASDAQYNTDTYTVNAEPGRYRLDILPVVDNASWTVTVTSSGGTGGGSGRGSGGSTVPQQSGSGGSALMQSGGPEDGPVPHLPSGGCPDEFPVKKAGSCNKEGR